MTECDFDRLKEIAERYGIKVTLVEKGKGGVFFTDENGKTERLTNEDIINTDFKEIYERV